MTKTTILLTRPAGENAGLQKRLAAAGLDAAAGIAVQVRPLVKITRLDISPQTRNQAVNLDEQDLLVFVSRPAARHGMALIDEYWPTLPAGLQLLAVGPGTAAVLREYDVRADYPDVPGSEGLLDMPALQSVKGKNILIACGLEGRSKLADTLSDRGARVTRLETYRRDRADVADLGEMLAATQVIVVLTSVGIMQNFAAQLARLVEEETKYAKGQEAMPLLGRITAVVASERIACQARQAGFTKVINAGAAADISLYDALMTVLSDQ